MANGYASNIPVENAAPEPEMMPAQLCIVCKRNRTPRAAEQFCAECAKALAT